MESAIPTDLGPYAVLVTLFTLACGGFAVAVKWLDNRGNSNRAELLTRIEHLEQQVNRLEQGHATAQGFIVEAIAKIDPKAVGAPEVQALLMKASSALM